MKRFYLSILLSVVVVDHCDAELKTVNDFGAAAAKANAVLTIPDWEQTPEAVDAAMKDAIAKANKALDQIGTQDPGKVSFKSTVVALDNLTYAATLEANKVTIIKETNTNAAMRTAAENAVKIFQDWAVSIDYREDVYKALKAFADTHPKLSGEDEKLLFETMRDYRRAGLELSPDKRKEVEQLRKELSKLGTDFDTNIVKAKAPVIFTKAELDGVPESFFASPGVKTGDDAYTVMANVTWQFIAVEENAKSEATRKKLYVIHDRDIGVFSQTVVDHVQLLASRFVFCVFLDGVELPGDIRHHGVDVVAGFDAGRGEEAFRKPIEIGFAEHDRSVGLNDVGVEICSQLRQLLAQSLNFFALIRRQFQPGTPIIA